MSVLETEMCIFIQTVRKQETIKCQPAPHYRYYYYSPCSQSSYFTDCNQIGLCLFHRLQSRFPLEFLHSGPSAVVRCFCCSRVGPASIFCTHPGPGVTPPIQICCNTFSACPRKYRNDAVPLKCRCPSSSSCGGSSSSRRSERP